MAMPTGVRDAVVSAYYPRALASPDSARSRAQAGYTIASAIAAALVAAGVLSEIDSQPGVIQILGLGALTLWMATAWLYMSAVSVPVRVIEGLQLTEDEFVGTALSNAKIERDEVDRRQRRARWVSFAAVLLTLATFVAAVRFPTAFESPSTSIEWSRTDREGKLSIETTGDRLQRHDRVETDVLGVKLNGQHLYLIRGTAEADASGRVELRSEVSVASDLYEQFVIKTVVRRGRDRLHQEELLLRPE
jgi:hypothetical protein